MSRSEVKADRQGAAASEAPATLGKTLSKLEALALMYAAKAKPGAKPSKQAAPPAGDTPGAAAAPIVSRLSSPTRSSAASRRAPLTRLQDAFRVSTASGRRAALAAAVADPGSLSIDALDDAVAAVAGVVDASERSSLASALLGRHLFHGALRCVLAHPAQLLPLLADIKTVVWPFSRPDGCGAGGAPWIWPSCDRESLCGAFAGLPPVRSYAATRAQLLACGSHGLAAAARLEAHLLLRAVEDFESQLRSLAPAGTAEATDADADADAATAAAVAAPLDAHELLSAAKAQHEAALVAEARARRDARAAAKAAEERERAASAASAAAATPPKPTRHHAPAAASPSAPPCASPFAPRAEGERHAAARRAAEEASRKGREALAALERQKAALAAKLAAERARSGALLAAVTAEKEVLEARLRQVAPPAAQPAHPRPHRSSTSAPRPVHPGATHEGEEGAFTPQHNAEVSSKPTSAEVAEYAAFLGMDVEQDQHLFYIAEWALTAPLPGGWSEHSDEAGLEYFHCSRTGQSTYEHPLDEQYRKFWRGIKDGTAAAPVASPQPQPEPAGTTTDVASAEDV